MRNDSWDETQIDRLERTIADRFQMLCIRLGHGMCTIGSASCVCCVVLYVCLMNAQYSIYIYSLLAAFIIICGTKRFMEYISTRCRCSVISMCGHLCARWPENERNWWGSVMSIVTTIAVHKCTRAFINTKMCVILS